MRKETRLDENAEIYKKREKKTERQKLSEMNFKEKVSYFRDYYLKKVIVLILAAAALTSLFYSIFRERPEVVLTAVVIDSFFQEEYVTEITDETTKLLITDTEKQEIDIDTQYYYSQDEYSASMKFMTRIAAAELDVIIARKSRFIGQAANDTLLNLEEILSADEMAELGEQILYTPVVDIDAATMEKTYGESLPFGIILNNLNDYQGYDLSDDPLVIGIVVNSQYKENALKFIRYMMQK